MTVANSDQTGYIERISGPVVQASNMLGSKLYDVARIGDEKLVGEIIKLTEDMATIQVYESTDGLTPGEPVYRSNEPLSVELGPGLIRQIFDGIQRPLPVIREISGDFMERGIDIPGLDHKKLWDFTPLIELRCDSSPKNVQDVDDNRVGETTRNGCNCCGIKVETK